MQKKFCAEEILLYSQKKKKKKSIRITWVFCNIQLRYSSTQGKVSIAANKIFLFQINFCHLYGGIFFLTSSNIICVHNVWKAKHVTGHCYHITGGTTSPYLKVLVIKQHGLRYWYQLYLTRSLFSLEYPICIYILLYPYGFFGWICIHIVPSQYNCISLELIYTSTSSKTRLLKIVV